MAWLSLSNFQLPIEQLVNSLVTLAIPIPAEAHISHANVAYLHFVSEDDALRCLDTQHATFTPCPSLGIIRCRAERSGRLCSDSACSRVHIRSSWPAPFASTRQLSTSSSVPPASASPATLTYNCVPRSLDPVDWVPVATLAHKMVDELFSSLQTLRDRPVWQPLPQSVRALLAQAPVPREPQDLTQVYEDFRSFVRPYSVGNLHPRFCGWVHGAGTPVGALAELLSAGLNANLGGRDHAPIVVEQTIIRWAAELLGLPSDSSGLLLTGTSMANLLAVIIARTAALKAGVRIRGLCAAPLVAYASALVHTCVARALDFCGLGSAALRLVPCEPLSYRMSLSTLKTMVENDRAVGNVPFLLIGTAGSVDCGAIDPLSALAAFAAENQMWFHVDAAFGALGCLSPSLRPLFAGIERADSVAFDFHKWGQVPYDAGCLLVRDKAAHIAAFGLNATYLKREGRGLAGGEVWPCDFGPDLSRGFRALKVWFSLRTFGTDIMGDAILHTCQMAVLLRDEILHRASELQLLAPVALNIVCFRFVDATKVGDDVYHNKLNTDLVADLQEAGEAAPSTTTLRGLTAIRVAFVGHRTTPMDVREIVRCVLERGRARVKFLSVPARKHDISPMYERKQIAPTITQHVEVIAEDTKVGRLHALLQVCPAKVLVFVDVADRSIGLASLLGNAGVNVLYINGNMSVVERDTAVQDFATRADIPVLICTSVAGRGLRIDGVSTVINFDAPSHNEDYIHRANRMARVTGLAYLYTFVTPQEGNKAAEIIRVLHEHGLPIGNQLWRIAEAYHRTMATQASARKRPYTIEPDVQASWADPGFPPVDASTDKPFSAEIEINDYSQKVRWQFTTRNSLASLRLQFGCEIVVRGLFVPAGGAPTAGSRKLYLMINGHTQESVTAAGHEIREQIEAAALMDGLPKRLTEKL